MERVNLTDTKAHLSKIIDRVEAGESIEITRHGKVVVQIKPIRKPLQKIDIAALLRLHEGQQMQAVSAGGFVREMRDSDRY